MAAPELSLERAREAAAEATAALDQPENLAKIMQAIQLANGDMMMLMTLGLPVGISIVGPVVSKYGFPPNQQGIMMFVATLRRFNDPELTQLEASLRRRFLAQ
eukprot:gnl/Hemi2/9344_TR3261_c0_g1_i1.p2 gnl/Hemi2/9344_TR3261_c0_g1~~gnl/Hemi2/9344_TR3261_c0_g1_i1.p2  ORF type:complete len:103 (-),score=12.96 gnl/Hemi2/9344_TR3261_c0_g1_i1:248-556(-)